MPCGGLTPPALDRAVNGFACCAVAGTVRVADWSGYRPAVRNWLAEGAS